MSNKYGAKQAVEDGYVFSSHAELRRYRELKLMVMAGAISNLEVHPSYPLVVNGVKIGKYTADFNYFDEEWEPAGCWVVEDVKSSATKTEAFGLRKKLMWALHGINVVEVEA